MNDAVHEQNDFSGLADLASPNFGTTIAEVSDEFFAAAERMLRERVADRPVISSGEALLDYLALAMGRLKHEQFRLLFLDRKNTLIADEVQQRGTIDHAPVYPREVARRALELQASAVILVHNHPSGDPQPSQADIDMTRQVARALAAVEVTLHDHLIIARGGQASLRSLGLISDRPL